VSPAAANSTLFADRLKAGPQQIKIKEENQTTKETEQ
jgi:hypothetical protein